MTNKISKPKNATADVGDVYGGISDARVDELRLDIEKDLHAEDAARELISHAKWCIASGQKMPVKLRNMILDGLWHARWKDPLSVFGNIRPVRPAKKGRPRKESDREWLEVMRDVLRVHEGGIPLTGEGEKRPYKQIEGTAFMEYARNVVDGNDFAVAKEARRIQAGFWKHMGRLPPARWEVLGLSQYIPRKK
ncbi:MAG: hypothetical protein QM601_06310 [Pseudoxanthomonas sp.]